MAKPRVFISSTFYDLRQLRADLDRFVRDLGYEPVLHELGAVPYEKNAALEESCYREIDSCDIVVSVVGDKLGTGSGTPPYSISQKELQRALEGGKQVYVFVLKTVMTEFRTYLRNKESENVTYEFVDDVQIYKFLEEITALPTTHPIEAFETSVDITTYLEAQWAGLFQRLLQEDSKKEDVRIAQELAQTAETLNRLVEYLQQEKSEGDETIREIVRSNHPAFEALRKALGARHRIYFLNKRDMLGFISAYNYRQVKPEKWDSPTHGEWIMGMPNGDTRLLKTARDIFESGGALKVIGADDWKEDNIIATDIPGSGGLPPDSDIPF